MSAELASAAPIQNLDTHTFEDGLETNEVFADEAPARTLGRLGWLTARSMAEFVLVATDPDLGLTAVQQDAIISKAEEIADDFHEFVDDGVAFNGGLNEGDYHPREAKVRKRTDRVIKEVDRTSNYSHPRSLYDGMFELTAEDLLALLKERKRFLAGKCKES